MARLTASLQAVRAEERRTRPLDIAAGVATIEREFRHRGSFGIAAHDAVREAVDRLSAVRSALIQQIQNETREAASHLTTSEGVLDQVRPAATYAAVLAYWGESRTDRWWFQDLEELAHRPHVGGSTALIYLTRSPAMTIAYAAGAAAAAAERWDLVFRLLREPKAEDHTGSKWSDPWLTDT
jgi:hypothetical protein